MKTKKQVLQQFQEPLQQWVSMSYGSVQWPPDSGSSSVVSMVEDEASAVDDIQ